MIEFEDKVLHHQSHKITRDEFKRCVLIVMTVLLVLNLLVSRLDIPVRIVFDCHSDLKMVCEFTRIETEFDLYIWRFYSLHEYL